MARLSTRSKIIQAALALFAREGVSNVKLQQIADDVGISVGNLAYHFKHKEALIETVYELGLQELNDVLQLYLQASSLVDFDRQLNAYYEFVEQFHFCYTCNRDLQGSQPGLMSDWQAGLKKMLTQFYKRLQFYQHKGWLQAERWPGCYEQLAHNIFLSCCYWLPQHLLVDAPTNPNSFRQAIWSQIRPHFSPEGEAVFTRTIVLTS